MPFLLAAVSMFALAANAATLTFNTSATITRVSGGESHSTTSKVFLRGEQARVESRLGEQKIVVLWLKPYAYRLLPSAKSGVRYKASTPMPELQALSSNWPQLMNDPSRIRGALRQQGANKVGMTRLNGVSTEIYKSKRWNGKNQPLTLWIRQSDALPIRLETRSGEWKVSINWSRYVRNPRLADSLFAVPKHYRIREGAPPRNSF